MMKYPDFTAGDGEFLLNIIGGWDVFQQVKKGTKTLIVKAVELLAWVAEISLPAVRKFVVAKAFVIDTSATAKVKIGYLGNNFGAVFPNKVEKNIPATTLTAHQLVKKSLDQPILEQLGDKAETTLANLYKLLTRQPKGESGILLTNGRANIFYVKASGKLWAVCAGWDAGYGSWDVDAGSVECSGGWYDGGRVFSRK